MLFFGKINDAKFTTAMVGRKNGNSLTSWNRWTANFRFGDQVVPNFWESGIKIISSSIDAGAKKTQLQFSRPLIVPFPETMDLQSNVNYQVYLSHGIFPNGFNTQPENVRGDSDGDYPLWKPF